MRVELEKQLRLRKEGGVADRPANIQHFPGGWNRCWKKGKKGRQWKDPELWRFANYIIVRENLDKLLAPRRKTIGVPGFGDQHIKRQQLNIEPTLKKNQYRAHVP